MTIKQTIKDKVSLQKYYQAELKKFRLEARRLKGLDLTAVSSINIYETSVYFSLDPEVSREQHQEFIHKLTKHYSIGEMKKEKSWNEDSLEVSGRDALGRHIEVRGYVPPTCKLEQFEVEAESWELEAARKNLEKAEALLAAGKKLVSKVVCQ